MLGAMAGSVAVRAESTAARGLALCRAPFASLHLDQMGDARPCCQSTYVLGNVQEQTLEEIWTGERARRLRDAIDAGDLSLGCGYCAWAGRGGDTSGLYARRYDELVPGPPSAGPARLEIAPSNTCNLMCEMCNGDWSSAIRARREHRPPLPKVYGDAFFEQLEDWLPGLRQVEVFGGEPLLARESLRLLELLAERNLGTEVRITTNGTVWNPRVARLVGALAIDVVVSVDGASAATYEAIRVGASWDAVRENLARFREATDAAGAELDLAHCLMVENWWELPELLRLAADLRAPAFVNTVLSPVASSLHHLSPPELAHVVRGLEARTAEVEALGEPWTSTWSTELDLLRATLADAAAGRLHPHLGGADGSPGFHLLPPEPEPPDRPVRTLEVATDADLRVAHVEVVGDGAALGPLDADDLVGKPSSAAIVAGSSAATVLARDVLAWGEDRTREERVSAVDAGLLCEGREVVAGPDGLRVRVEQRLLPDEAELAARVRTAAGDGAPLVELEIGTDRVVVAVEPSVEAAAALGLDVAPGATVLDPADALAAEHLDPAPEAALFRADPLTTVGELRWADGTTLVVAARQRYEAGRPGASRVFLARRPPPPGSAAPAER